MHHSLKVVMMATLVSTSAHAEIGEESTRKDTARPSDIAIESLAKLDNPWGLAFLPDGRLLITEKPGRLRIFDDGKLSDPVGGVPRAEYKDQGGLLDVAIDPNFETNKLVYLSYSEAAETQPSTPGENPADARLGKVDTSDVTVKGLAVARGRLDGGALEDSRVIWRQTPKTVGRNHFGGRLAFGKDGTLFIVSGDRQRFTPAQDFAQSLGKVLRINADGTIPSDNPFVGKEGALKDIWSLGHRNPLGAVVHPETGELWINEMGPLGGDEINVVKAGQNYGWPEVSNGDHYDKQPIPRHDTRPDFAPPAYSWNPSISPSGMIFYRGSLFRDWTGNVLLGGLSSKALIRLTVEGNQVVSDERIELDKRVRDVIEAPDGTVLVLTDGDDGELLRLTPSKSNNRAAQ